MRQNFKSAIVCPENHDHELTTVCYTHHKCRCEWCVSEARARYQERMGAHGKWLAEEMIPEIEHFLSLGVNGRVAIEQMGLNVDTVRSILYKHKRADLVAAITKEQYH